MVGGEAKRPIFNLLKGRPTGQALVGTPEKRAIHSLPFAISFQSDKIKLYNMNDQNYKTDDMYLAAYLLTRGYKITENDRSLPKEVVLFFNASEIEIQPIAKDYEDRKLSVEPRKFVSAIREIKSIVQIR